jgi:hypothetical protein
MVATYAREKAGGCITPAPESSMVIRVESLTEPIPGYRLLERLGGGGFGDVWKCEAPGGLLKAIKFVHGTLHGLDDAALVQQELRSLNRVKGVRHPFILSLERYDIIDGQLVIVMELADRNLWDRFQECRNQGLPGIPRAELLRYMEEAAEALDLMNIEHQLQHLDIKPQNLFLVHSHVKVADFGLVKDLECMNQTAAAAVTPIYAAPETFEGDVSRSSDQYSLAVVYQELLTGLRPFGGANARQLLMQHQTANPDLTPLPPCDRPAIGRALGKKPEDRFPTCTDLVRALRQAGQGRALPPDHAGDLVETPAVVRLSPTAYMERPAGTATQPLRSATVSERRPAAPPVPEITGDGVLFPALVIGLGGLGRAVLEQLRGNLRELCGPAEAIPHIRLLALDSDPEGAAAAAGAEPALTEDEVVIAPLNKPAHYLKPIRNRAALDTWLNLSMLCRVPRQQTTPTGLRILGRLVLVDNYRKILARLRSELQACTSPRVLVTADHQTRLGVRSNRPRVYVVTGLGGGTGSGMFIDVAYVIRHLLRDLGYPEPEVVGLLLLPSATPATRQSPALGNTYAALTELHHFSAPEVTYQAFFDELEEPVNDSGAPFTQSVMVPLPEESNGSATREVTGLVGDFLARQLVTPLGRHIDRERAELIAAQPAEQGLCQAFGAYRFTVPRRAVVGQVSRALTQRLVQSWLTADRLVIQRAVKAHLSEEWRRRLELQPEALTGALDAACERALGEPPEATFAAVLMHGFRHGPDSPAAIDEALIQLERLVAPQGDDQAHTPLTEAVSEAARVLSREAERKVADLIAGLVDDPRFRVAGAEEAIQQVTGLLAEALRSSRVQLQEAMVQAAERRAYIQGLIVNLRKGSWWPGRMAKTAAELRQTLEQLPRLRFQALVLRHIVAVYQGVLGVLPRRQEEVTFCRQRLGDFQRSLGGGRAAERNASDPGFGEHFLPMAADTVDAAVEVLLKNVKPEDLLALDQKVQGLVRRQFKSLAQMCLGPTSNFQDLRALIEQQAETHVESILGKASAAAVYLQDRHADAEIRADLSRAFDEAIPKLAGSRFTGPELCFLTVPADVAGERLGKLAAEVVDDVRVVSAGGAIDVYFYREQPRLPLADLPQFGLLAEQIYRQMTVAGSFTPHTRMDVLQWVTPM